MQKSLPQKPALKTKRLRLRRLTAADAARVAELAGDWDIARMTARIPHPYAAHAAEGWVQHIADDEFVRAIDLNDEVIGLVGYTDSDDGSGEIGYWIGKPWWGHGYATEAATGLIRYCFRSARLPRLTCCHFVDNPASKRVIEKLGFRETGRCRAYSEARQCDVDTIRYELKRPLMARIPTRLWGRAA